MTFTLHSGGAGTVDCVPGRIRHYQYDDTPHCNHEACPNHIDKCADLFVSSSDTPCRHAKRSDLLEVRLTGPAVDYLVDLVNTEVQSAEEELREHANADVHPGGCPKTCHYLGQSVQLEMLRVLYRELREVNAMGQPKRILGSHL